MSEETKPSWRDRLKKLTASESAPTVPVVTKPAKKSSVIPQWMRAVAQGRRVDRDGQVLRPSDGQRSTASWLSSISPRSRD